MPSMTGGTIGTSPLGSASLDAQALNAIGAAFDVRVQAAMATVALEVIQEAGTITNDTNRKILATRVLQQAGSLTGAFALAVVADLTTVPSCSDQTLLTRIEAIWDSMAGVL
jgi:hypothetical protein